MKKVLIVEDDRKIGLALFARLRANGYEAFIALDAEAGLKMAIKHRPDLVILDISLPTRSGLNLAAQLRSLPMTTGMALIFMTAHHNIRGFQTKAAELGAVAFIEKPLKDGELISVVRMALAETPTTPPATPSQENTSDSQKSGPLS
ncbi:MAG: response regulator [bacterium]